MFSFLTFEDLEFFIYTLYIHIRIMSYPYMIYENGLRMKRRVTAAAKHNALAAINLIS